MNSLIQKIHSNGARYFAEYGIPSRQQEEWKYTSLKSLNEAMLQPAQPGMLSVDLQRQLAQVCSPRFLNLVFVDGRLSDTPLPQGLTVTNDNWELIHQFKKVRRGLGAIRQDSLEALNAAKFAEALFISLPEGKRLSKPLQMVFVSTTRGAQYPKVFISLGRGSELSIIETSLGGEGPSLINSVVEILLEPKARLQYTKFQNQSRSSMALACTRIYLKSKSQLESLVVSVGAQLSRHNLDIYCLGDRASAQVNGLTMSSGDQHMDNHTHIEHVVGNCRTTQLYKSIVDGESRVVFNGRVHIRRSAQKASSEQLNNNLLLSSGSEADSKPQLDIYADDVKATHGSTVGQLDPEELFYFLSRGISREQALEMLALGFAQDLLDRVTDFRIKKWLSMQLKQAYGQMRGPP